MTFLRTLVLSAVVATLAAGCSWFSKKNEPFKSATRPSQPLEVPPELTAPAADDRFAIPDPRNQTTFSTYQQRTQTGAVATAAPVLPKIEGARIERVGNQRWLVVKGAPEAVWPKVRDFWVESGYSLVRESPEVGIIETDWYEDRSKIPEDFVRRAIGRVLERVYSTSYRDKYRTRLEKGAEPGTTEVYVTHRGVEEVFTNTQQDTTKWQPRPEDPGLEAEMLNRIMVKLGAPEMAPPTVAAAKPASSTTSAASAAQPRNAILENGVLVVSDGFDRAWRRVGLALDRVGFTVEDRDRSKGVFFVRYIDPDVDLTAGQKKSFLESLKFWKPSPKAPQPQYRIHVGDAGGGLSQVDVQNAEGQADNSATARRILSLLYDQLK
jgi:outer membrane protein assembly factor BamC